MDYAAVTERVGQKASREQVERIYQRYRLAARLAGNGAVIEIGCGTGMGLGYLAQYAARVVGVDIDERNLALAAQGTAGLGNVEVRRMDSHDLRFPDASFDLALVYEAIYYFREPERVVAGIARLLRPGGRLIVCTVNPGWSDFHPSPFSTGYLAVPELNALLAPHFAEVAFYGGFPTRGGGAVGAAMGWVKRLAVRLHLIPGSLAARAVLKRLFFGPLVTLPAQVSDGMAPFTEPAPIAADRPDGDHKIVYAVARKAAGNP